MDGEKTGGVPSELKRQDFLSEQFEKQQNANCYKLKEEVNNLRNAAEVIPRWLWWAWPGAKRHLETAFCHNVPELMVASQICDAC